ncbi:MAG TPA: hypothetical protein VGO93_21335, partial [Candidatus Xenobia bacterium]
LLPVTADPRDVRWQDDPGWVLKAAWCNTGDTVAAVDVTPAPRWAQLSGQARRRPERWIVQRRFEPLRVSTPWGDLLSCIGVYTVNGKTAGAYARVTRRPFVDGHATDVALLVGDHD